MMTRMMGCLSAAGLVLLAACGSEKADGGAGIAMAEPRGGPPLEQSAAGARAERTATIPESACDWFPAEEVEALVGKLSGAPREEQGGCFYPLPVDSITIARRTKADQVRAALERAGMKSDWPAEPPDTGGVLIHVSVGKGAEERASELGFATAGSWVGNDSLLASDGPGDGWDYRRRLPGKPNFWGRAGTVIVVVEGGTHGMEDSVLARLAGRVRDRIPDLPFVDPSEAQAVRPGRDPCAVLSRAEAEAVLGKLVVAPYRTREGGALPDLGGESCAYYTAGHRALMITPHYADGADEMRFIRGRGGLGAIGVVDALAEAADTLEGPWDEVAIGVEGQLAVLKGGRMVEIAYLTSSTDLAGAIRLAGPALRGLAGR